mgnify:CR=1 FL=1
MIKIFIYFLQSILIYIFFITSRIIGLKLSRNLFSFIFIKFGKFFKSQKIIIQNLERITKNLNNNNKEKVIEKMWSNYGKTFIEYVHLNYFRKNSNHIEIVNKDIIKNLVKNNKKAIFISGHFANYELMSMELTKLNLKLATIYRPLNNIFLNSFMESLRKKFICKNQIKKGVNGVRESINYLKNNHCLALMIDQRVSEGEKIKFFNNMALTTTLPAQLAMKYNLEIIPVFIERINENKFNIEFYKPINPNHFENKIKLTEKLNNVLETMIVRNPSQWIWTHNRWK